MATADAADAPSSARLSSETIEGLFNAHYEDLCRFAVAHVQDAHAAEDLVQDIFLGLWSRGTLPDRPKAYLFRAVTNRLINYNQQQRVVRRQASDWHARPPAGGDRADARLHRQALQSAVRRAVEALPTRQRQVFDLSRNGGLTYAEIAETLGLSVKTVETHMSRALQSLRKRIGQHL